MWGVDLLSNLSRDFVEVLSKRKPLLSKEKRLAMELLFEYNRTGNFEGNVERGVVHEQGIVWLSAQKYRVSTPQESMDVQKILHVSPGLHLYLLDYDTKRCCRFRVRPTTDLVVAMVQLRGKTMFKLGREPHPYRMVSGQYSLFSFPDKELRFTLENGSQGQSLLVFMPRDYIGDFALHYRGAKRLIPKSVLRCFPSSDMERPFVDSRTRSVTSFLLGYLGTELHPDTFLVGLTVKTFVSLLLSPKENPKNNLQVSDHSQKLEDIVALVLSDLSEFPGIKGLARKMHVNTTTFKKLFALKTGLPPLRFWQNKRMESAYELLSLKNTRPSEVADILGYSSLHAFDKAFKKHFGVPPTAIIRKVN